MRRPLWRFLLCLCLSASALTFLSNCSAARDEAPRASALASADASADASPPQAGAGWGDAGKRRDEREVTVYVTRTGEKYHRGSCRHLRRSKIPMSLYDAKRAGYTACKVCRPRQ